MNPVIIALSAGLTGMLGWGISDFFAKKTIDKIGDLKTLIGSQIIGASFLLIFFLFGHPVMPDFSLRLIIGVILLASLDGFGYLLLYRAFEKGIMSVVSPIAASAAGFSVLVSTLLFKEKLSLFGIIGVFLIFTGIIITSTNFKDLRHSFSRKNFSRGVPEAIAVMFLIGLWFPLWDKFVSDQQWLFWLVVLKFLMGTGLFIYSLKIYKRQVLSGYRSVVKILIPVAILDALAYLGTTWGYVATNNTTSLITLMANAYSLPTIILAYFLLKERINKTQIMGISCILLGIIISSI